MIEVSNKNSHFELKTQNGTLNSKKVIISVLGSMISHIYLMFLEKSLSKVLHYYNESHPYYKMNIAIVGAGNSAVDVALDTYRKGAKSVTMIIREKQDR